ncbi:MAG TPA: adenylate/guanylate cyclase domain-containing protein [Candidatus Dormibacteraeota bacterium]|nr:adenylate/guanylate cyclase domain-containing protein [Candidatus Dormibacteraeota bacterium]
MSLVPVTRYARNGDVHLAYQVLGEGPPDLVVVPSGPSSHMDHQWEEPNAARTLRRLASFSRLIMYDNRGVGLSDPVGAGEIPTMQDDIDDLKAILDAVGAARPVLMGMYAGGATSMVFAATHPERVEALVLMSSYACLRRHDDYPNGVEDAVVDQVAQLVLGSWGTGASLDVTNPSVARDPAVRRWYAAMERLAASPGTAAAMARKWFDVDVRHVLPAVRAPALVISRDHQPLFDVAHTRYLAEHLPTARYVELQGQDLHYMYGDSASALDAIEQFVTGTRHAPDPDRFLGTVLFIDIVGSTQLAVRVGDREFRELLDSFHEMFKRQLERYQGRLIDTSGDGALALFESPARAIACAQAMRDAVRALDLSIRAGVHTGEMERESTGNLRGIAVHIGARVMGLGGAGEILVSRTVRDLVAGSALRFESRGTHELKGVPEPWEIYGVT